MIHYPKPVSILSEPLYTDVRGFLGDSDVPNEVSYQRKASADVYRYLGTPILIKRMYTIEDVDEGIALEAATMDDIYKQSTYNTDLISHGVGYVSKETQPGEWVGVPPGSPDGKRIQLYVSEAQPYPNYVPAPRYRGYGPGFLTYAILPDRPEDQWKLSEQGALIRTQTAMVQLPWWPLVGDNDLIIVCKLDSNGRIVQTYERYKLKMTAPITMHGRDRLGRREFEGVNANNNRYWVGWQAEMTLVPYPDEIYKLEVDR
jgi:hypothetical protein